MAMCVTPSLPSPGSAPARIAPPEGAAAEPSAAPCRAVHGAPAARKSPELGRAGGAA